MSDENQCAMPTVEEQLERLRRDVNALYRLIPDNLEREQEERRQARWWATYNAALTGLLVGNEIGSENEQRAHNRAKLYADRNHGPLAPKVA